jgi:hypothetical protein
VEFVGVSGVNPISIPINNRFRIGIPSFEKWIAREVQVLVFWAGFTGKN